MACTIRLATIDDVDRVAPLFDAYREFYGLVPDLTLARRFLEDRLARGESVVLLAVAADGTSMGFVQMYPGFSSLRAARTFVLYDLFVRPGARRAGAVALVLSTAKTNVSAQRLYESLGWVRDEDFYEYGLDLSRGRGTP